MTGPNKTMRLSCLFRLAILLTALTQSALAGIRPSFFLDLSTWRATTIVLVQTTPIDGAFEVIESWKGDLPAGTQITIPELIPAPNAMSIDKFAKAWRNGVPDDVGELVPKPSSNTQMVLFLKSADKEVSEPDTAIREGHPEWKPADAMDSMKASVVWIEGSELYCFAQTQNPGPSIFRPMMFCGIKSERQMQNRIVEVVRTQENMTAVLPLKEEQRVQQLKPYVQSDIRAASMQALEEIAKSGPSAIAVLSQLLDDPSFLRESAEIVDALVKTGSNGVGPILNRLLEQDITFWTSIAPSLSDNWWEELISYPLKPTAQHYERTAFVIRGLEQVHYDGSLATAQNLRDLWRSRPPLNSGTRFNHIADQCDELISQLKKAPE